MHVKRGIFKMKGQFFIGGQWLDHGRERTDVTNPATGEVVGSVPNGTKSDVNDAVEAARKAFPDWSKRTVYERAELLEKLYAKMIEKKMNWLA